jgi:hypothetical protein
VFENIVVIEISECEREAKQVDEENCIVRGFTIHALLQS